MSSVILEEFLAYAKTHCLTRVRMSSVPDSIKPLVQLYRDKLSEQLNDPENESWASLPPHCYENALSAVKAAYFKRPMKPAGNCPRCAGTGFILAFSHVRGGRCLKCDGTGNCKL